MIVYLIKNYCWNIIECLGILATFILSIIALRQTQKANCKADKANCLSEMALKDTQKEKMPFLIFDGVGHYELKYSDELKNEVTFDFSNQLLKAELNDQFTTIIVNVKNTGTGKILGIRINELLIQEGNEYTLQYECDDENLYLVYAKNEEIYCERHFVLNEGETMQINLMLGEKLIRDNDEIKEFFKNIDTGYISISFEIKSINDAKYNQKYLTGYFVTDDNSIKFTRNEVSKIVPKEF